MKKVIIVLLGFFLFLALTSAQVDCTNFAPTTTVEILSQMPQINAQLEICNLQIPEDFNFALNNKNIFVLIDMNSGETEAFYISIVEGKISSINQDPLDEYSYYVVLSESTMDNILQSDNKLDTFLTNLDNGNIMVDARGFIATMTWFFANLFF